LTGESGAMGTGKRSPVMFRTRFRLSFLALFALVACGEKVPESSAAKQVGGTPKQIVDKAAADAAAAANQGAERSKSEEDKK
jgi:hypothetical protein